MNLDLENRSALVCGASQGIGLAIAEALADEGCRVGLLARSADKLEHNVARLAGLGQRAVALVADMGDWPSVEAALAQFGAPDILVTNTGGPPPAAVTAIDPGLWQRQFEAMVLNQMRLVTAALPAMRAGKFGRILNIASTTVIEPYGALPLSGALRAALANWLKLVATEAAADGVTVNTLLPGSIDTERVSKLNAAEAQQRGIAVEQVVAQSCAAIPAGRYGTPREFAAVAAFLASPRASYVTGQMIRIDGGVTKAP